ncbi:hypothetical protein KAU45_06670 [bacterium]|nr:hypothetical protein [bacterium]
MRLSRLGLLLTPILMVLLVVGCTDPITSGPYQDQNQPASPGRVMVYPPYDLVGHPEYPGTLLVYRLWTGVPLQPEPLDKPYITMYQYREPYYTGFKVWRKANSETTWTELTDGRYMVPETKRDVPITADAWADSQRRIIYDKPNVDFTDASNVELDFPAYRPDLDGFKGDQNPLEGWDVSNPSGYYPYRYFFTENHTFGFVDTSFNVDTMDYDDYRWAVCIIDYSGNMSDPVIVEVN